jgi:hypothetical protein
MISDRVRSSWLIRAVKIVKKIRETKLPGFLTY